VSDSKRPGGSRDISDLKARLGLKKGAAAPQTGQNPRANGAAGGVVAPPGMNLPPPPGVQQPQQPIIPNASEDPFGAMNAMAAHHTVQRAPEIVIVNDGKPVENVGAQSSGASIAKLAVPAVLALIVGVAIGKIGTSASSYNAGLSDARAILGDRGTQSTVANLKQELSKLDTLLDETRSKNQFKPDKALDTELEKVVNALDVKAELIFRAKQNALDPEVSGQIMSFYAGVAEVKSMLDLHIKSAKSDDLVAAKKAKEKQDANELKEDVNTYLNGQPKWGALIQAPTEEDKGTEFGVRVVELGPPYCGEKMAPSGKCAEGESVSGFAYRAEPGATWTKGDIATSGQDNVPTKKLVLFLPGGVRDGMVKGAEGVASEAYYQRRLRSIYDRVRGTKQGQGLLDQGNKLETRLQTESQKGKKFSFFM
jgi:hypothetical protein